MSRLTIRFSFVLLFLAACPILAAPPRAAEERQAIIGKPARLQVHPTSIAMSGPRSGQQILVTGVYADGSTRDLTALASYRSGSAKRLSVDANGFVQPRSDGKSQVSVTVGSTMVSIPVVIRGSKRNSQVSFRGEFMPVLSAAGCSDIRCHGAPSGKNGFRLSLWGFDPALDFAQLTRAGHGRRTNAFNPEQSLIYRKAVGLTPHAGRKRFAADSHFARLFRDWQLQGMQDDSKSSALKTVEVTPFNRVLHAPALWQQLAVRATFADGVTRDVTRLTTFSSTDRSIATVTRGGQVEFHRQGEAAILCRFLGKLVTVRLTHIATPLANFRWPNPPKNNYVDQHVFAKLKMMNIAPSALCSDQEFVRRVYLDVCGILPSPQEARDFVTSTMTDKRSRLIDRLLHRPEYAQYWTKKWMDVLRVSRDAINLAGATAYQDWFYERINQDKSFAGLVKTLVTSTGKSYSRPESNFYCVVRTPERITDPFYLQKDLAEATSQLFLGVRLQCAKCHNHPYERWTQQDYLGMSAFFAQIKRTRLGKAGPKGRPERRQIQIGLNKKAKEVLSPTGLAVRPSFPGESPMKIDPQADRRQVLAKWLTSKSNPFFAKAVVNRIWFHLHGRGIVDPVDDFRDSNPSVNDPLLNALAADFIAGGFRIRPIVRRILRSRTYQLSAKKNASNRTDNRYFSHMMVRPLPAEVLLDAICEVTGLHEHYEIRSDYTIGLPKGSVKMPAGTRAVQLPVTDIVTLINTNGRYVRYETHPFLRTFGQPARGETCECGREQNFGRKQALELGVGKLVTRKIGNPKNRIGRSIGKVKATKMLDDLFWRALARAPTTRARQALLKHVRTAKDKRKAWEDVVWIVLNSKEFIYQH